MPKRRAHLFSEILTIIKFGIVGCIATAMHLGIAYYLLTTTELNPFEANLIAFLAAFTVSFAGHSNWTFNTPLSQKKALIKFFTVSFSAFLLNNIILFTIIQNTGIDERIAVTLAAIAIPVMTFILSRFWVFRSKPSSVH